MEVTVIHDLASLAEHLPALQCLAQCASEPNPFYEPWMLEPALKTQHPGKLSMVLIWGPDPVRKNTPHLLCGFVPLEEKTDLYRLPVRHYTTWKHNYCFLCTPLLRKGQERETLEAFFGWLESHDIRPALAQFKYIVGEGVAYQALIDVMNKRGRAYCVWEVFNRALFKPRESAEIYTSTALSGVHRKEFRRRLRGLAEQGPISVHVAATQEEMLQARCDFLRIEASGWKGKQGTAFASKPEDEQFFEEITQGGFELDRVMMITMKAGDRPVAVKCNLLAGDGSFAFKIGFDEIFERYSPGAQMELENIRLLHDRPQIQWMDSCAEPVHFMINRMWMDRRNIQSVIVSTGGWTGDLLIPTLPWLKLVKARFLDKKSAAKNAEKENP